MLKLFVFLLLCYDVVTFAVDLSFMLYNMEMKIETFNNDPNFSVVMQGGCNANCSFCFNKGKSNAFMQCDSYEWLLGLQKVLSVLPSKFYQISITGNEPMLSPSINGVMYLCSQMKNRYSNILLTTNGTNLLDKIDVVCNGVHHINVSRHHYDESENLRIFGGSYNVSDSDLEEIIDRYSARGVDVSLNCVIDESTDVDFIYGFVHFAKRVGAYSVRFRKKNGDDLDMTNAERVIDCNYPILSRGECPVCRTWYRVIKGLPTFWKASVIEPTDKVKDSVYELVYDTDGGLYLDWSRSIPFSLSEVAKERVGDKKSDYVVSSCAGTRYANDHC